MSRYPRGVRARAVLAALLCASALFAPVVGRSVGAHHQQVHLVKAVTLAGSEQHASTTRLDASGDFATAPVAVGALPATVGSPQSAEGAPSADVIAVRTRGPPSAR